MQTGQLITPAVTSDNLAFGVAGICLRQGTACLFWQGMLHILVAVQQHSLPASQCTSSVTCLLL